MANFGQKMVDDRLLFLNSDSDTCLTRPLYNKVICPSNQLPYLYLDSYCFKRPKDFSPKVLYDNFTVGAYGRMYEGYLANAEDDVEGAIPVMIKTVVG